MPTLITTTIGSLYRFSEDLHESIDEAVRFQRELGLDIVSDGEQRSDMVSYFAEAFEGLAVEHWTPVVTGKIQLRGSPDEFSKVKDLDHMKSKFPDLRFKVAITGPTTLGMTCGSRKIRSHYKNIMDFSLYEDLADALAPIAKAIVDRGALLQIDEPFLSQGYKDLDARVRLIDRLTEGLPSNRIGVHVCGFVGGHGVVKHLLSLENIRVLSLAFSGSQERRNIEHVSRPGFQDNDKRLGAGCISVTPLSEEQVNTPEMVSAKLKEIAGKVGLENVVCAHPDCGMRATNKSLVPIILRNMRAGVRLFG